MDKDSIAAEFLKIYLNAHPELIPKDENKAADVLHRLHNVFKEKLIANYKKKSEKYVNRYFDDKDDDKPVYY
jgi:hypothetical protein